MSIRTIIEINHDRLGLPQAASLVGLLSELGSSHITRLLNENNGDPVQCSHGIRVLGQRHHSETLNLTVK